MCFANMSLVRKLQSYLMDPRAIVALSLVVVMFVLTHLFGGLPSAEPALRSRSTYHITKTWDSRDLGHSITVNIVAHSKGLQVIVDAPFFNDPPNPGGKVGQAFSGLWDFEVVEVFFLNDQNKYLEVELCPHGQHLVLLLNDVRKSIKDELPLEFQSSITRDSWHGEAIIPASYFPEKVTKFNAYAIHGTSDNRVYKALYPVEEGKFDSPDFHKLEYFQTIDFERLIPSNVDGSYTSEEWLV